MADLFDLSTADRTRLPERRRHRLWAAERNEDCPGTGAPSLPGAATVREECCRWLAWIDNLKPGDKVRYVGIAEAYRGKLGETVDCVELGWGVRFPGLSDTFSVRYDDLEIP